MTIPASAPETKSEKSSFARNPLDMIAHDHMVQVQLCDAMEKIADGLPDDVDRRLCAQVASCLQYDLPLHHHDEETGLFPLLRTRARPEDGIESILDRLAGEHVSDTDFAGEIAESLDLLGRGDKISNPEMVGYMLRGFFERYRRHVHWENTLVMPLARLRLTPADLDQLARQMDRNRAATL
jgi:hemerythrin-like domain-containing protein